MKAVVNEPIYRKGITGKTLTWVEPGTYDVVRFFCNNRVMIQLNKYAVKGSNRKITLVHVSLVYFEPSIKDKELGRF